MTIVKSLISKLLGHSSEFERKLEALQVLQGTGVANINRTRYPFASLAEAEFKVFSQFGEDGILQYLIFESGIMRAEQSFIEFGVQDYSESNTRLLLLKDNWRGLILDGSDEHMQKVRRSDLYWRQDLTAVSAWIDRDNINTLIGDSGFSGDVGLLSIDIDGNDYWVWERISVVRPIIVVTEWNSVFGSQHAVSVPYDPAFNRTAFHYSNLAWGASIAAFEHLASSKGYALVGSNSAGNNLFFVRNDRLGRIKRFTAQAAYVESRFRDSRNSAGELSFLAGACRAQEIIDVPLVDVISNTLTTLRQLGI